MIPRLIQQFIICYLKLKRQNLDLNLKCIPNIHLIFINNYFYSLASLISLFFQFLYKKVH